MDCVVSDRSPLPILALRATGPTLGRVNTRVGPIGSRRLTLLLGRREPFFGAPPE